MIWWEQKKLTRWNSFLTPCLENLSGTLYLFIYLFIYLLEYNFHFINGKFSRFSIRLFLYILPLTHVLLQSRKHFAGDSRRVITWLY